MGCTPVISAVQEAKAERLRVQNQPGLQSEVKASLENLVRPHFKVKKFKCLKR